MENSLSLILPVHNGQDTLAASVVEILEVLPELTASFELVIIDDGSTDATVEVADDLARRFPQVVVVRHGTARGVAESLRSGLTQSKGEIICFRDEDCGLAADDIHKLWKAVAEHPLVLGRARRSSWPKWRPWMQPSRHAGFKMFHRRAVEEVETASSDPGDVVEELMRRGYRWHEVQVRARRHGRLDAARPRRRTGHGARQEKKTGEKTAPGRPNYLSRLKEFAIGE